MVKRRKEEKRGISPLIATVLIIGFTVLLAILIINWGIPFIKNLQEKTEEVSLKSIACGLDVQGAVRNIKFIDYNKIKVLIDNLGVRDINKFKFRIFGSIGTDNVDTTIGLNAFEIKNFEITLNVSKVGIINVIEIFAIIDFKGEEFICNNPYAREIFEYEKLPVWYIENVTDYLAKINESEQGVIPIDTTTQTAYGEGAYGF